MHETLLATPTVQSGDPTVEAKPLPVTIILTHRCMKDSWLRHWSRLEIQMVEVKLLDVVNMITEMILVLICSILIMVEQ